MLRAEEYERRCGGILRCIFRFCVKGFVLSASVYSAFGQCGVYFACCSLLKLLNSASIRCSSAEGGAEGGATPASTAILCRPRSGFRCFASSSLFWRQCEENAARSAVAHAESLWREPFVSPRLVAGQAQLKVLLRPHQPRTDLRFLLPHPFELTTRQ